MLGISITLLDILPDLVIFVGALLVAAERLKGDRRWLIYAGLLTALAGFGWSVWERQARTTHSIKRQAEVCLIIKEATDYMKFQQKTQAEPITKAKMQRFLAENEYGLDRLKMVCMSYGDDASDFRQQIIALAYGEDVDALTFNCEHLLGPTPNATYDLGMFANHYNTLKDELRKAAEVKYAALLKKNPSFLQAMPWVDDKPGRE